MALAGLWLGLGRSVDMLADCVLAEGQAVIRSYEASVLSVEPRGDHQVATLRVQSLGTLAIEVSPHQGVQPGDVRILAVEMGLGEVVGREQQPANHR